MLSKPTKRRAMRLYRFLGALVLGLAACRPSPSQPFIPPASPTPGGTPSSAVSTSTPRPTYTPRPTPTPSAALCEWLGGPAGLPDLASLRWEERTLGPHRVRVLSSLPLLPIPPFPYRLTPDGRFLEVFFFTEEEEATREALVALDLAGTAHRLVQAPSCCLGQGWLEWLQWLREDPTLAARNRLPDGRRLRIDEAGRVRVENGETLTVDTPVPFEAVYPAGANSALGVDQMGQLWRGTLRPPAWERVQDAQGRPLDGGWILPVQSPDWALVFNVVFEFVPPTATPRSPRIEPGTRGPPPPTPTPYIPSHGAPVAFHFWRVPLKRGAPAVQLSTFRTEVMGTDVSVPVSVLLRDGRHLVLSWPFMVVMEGIWSISALVDVETGQRVAEGALGLPEGTILRNVTAIADGRWVLGEVIDRRTRQGQGIWVASGEDLSKHWTFEGWRGVQAWHPAGKGVMVWAGTMAEPERLGVLWLPPGPEGVRPLEGIQPPVGWAGDWVVGRAVEAPAKVRAVDPQGRVEELDLSAPGAFLQDVMSGRDRVWLVVGTVGPERRCRYTLVEWALPAP